MVNIQRRSSYQWQDYLQAWITQTCKPKLFKYFQIFLLVKVACRVQLWKKTFCQNSDYFCYCFIKNDIMFMHLLCIYKNRLYFKPFKIDTLNFTMYILMILTCPFKTYVVRLHNLKSMNIFSTIDPKRA